MPTDLPINDTLHTESRLKRKALRIFTLTVVNLVVQKYASRLFTRSSSVIFFLNFCIKLGSSVTLSEAHTMQFIARHTSIPVPQVYCAFTHHGKTYILMERIRGETVATRWRSLSDMSKSSIFNQLQQMIHELRSVPSQTNGVSSIDGGPIHDIRLQPSSWGPFRTITDFHSSLRNNITFESLEVPNSLSSDTILELKRLINFHESVQRAPVLTHGDLSSLNILIRDNKVVGIIDWDTAGWLPYYWEFTMAWHANPQNYFWQNEVGNFLDVQEEELNMEKIRRKYFGEV